MFARQKRSLFPIAFCSLLTATGIVVSLVSGCAASSRLSDSPNILQMGRATLSVRWPEGSRLIPFASDSIRVRIIRGNVVLGERLLVRPGQGGTVSTTFDRLPLGDAVVQGWAYPQADGSGVAQAMGQVGVTILNGQTVPVHLTLGSTVDHLTITPAGPHSLPIGSSLLLAATAKSAAGEAILSHPSTIEWQSLNPTVATVDPAGRVQAVSPGTATIQVRERESGKTATVPVNCGLSSGPNDDFNDNSINTDLWDVVNTGAGPVVAEVNQRLEITLPSTSGGLPAFQGGYRTRRAFRGNFDVQVDYQLLTWPLTNGVRVGITFPKATVQRVSLSPFEFGNAPRESYTGTHGVIETHARIGTVSTSGTLRLVRMGGVFTSYFRDASNPDWVPLLTGENDNSDQSIALLAWSSDTEFQHQNVTIAFDNFVVNKGELTP